MSVAPVEYWTTPLGTALLPQPPNQCTILVITLP